MDLGLLLLLGALGVSGLLAEGAVYDWCVLWMQQDLGQTQAFAALAYAGFSASMAANRFAGDWLRTHIPAPRLMAVSGVVAAAAMALALLLRQPMFALVAFVVVGAGPTGVEMAGQIQELSDQTLKGSFRHIDPTEAKVILLDAAPAVLPPMGEKLGLKAKNRLEKMGVEIQLGAMVTDVDRNGLTVKDSDGTIRRIEAACKVWSAGVQASPLGRDLVNQSDTEIDRAGRVKVNPDLSIPGHPNVFVVGDMAFVEGVPGMAQGAIQGGKHVAGILKNEAKARAHGTKPKPREPFSYFDKGSMATVSKWNAVAQIPLGAKTKLEFGGFIAWLAWLGLHLIYLVGFKTKIATLLSWTVTFMSRQRGQLTITEQQAYARTRIGELEEIVQAVVDPETVAS